MPGRARGRKVRDGAEAHELLRAWSASGEPMSTWCGRRGINWYSLSAYRGWRDRDRDRGERVELVEVLRHDAIPVVASPARYHIAIRDWVVEVAGNFEEEPLRRLLRVVASC